MPGVPDEKILERANGEGRIVLTEDRDFGKLTMHMSLPAIAIVIAHASDFPGPAADIATFVANTMEQLDTALIGQLTTIEPGRVRQRPLPVQP